MAVPRVFISSTYYDLKQIRNNIKDFIESLGYDTVMHEHADVTYTQTKPLELDCYDEIANCDIVVCIIGNNFGTQSKESDHSITMTEVKKAIKSKKKVYVFIVNDVYTENKTYELNKDFISFKSAYVDDLKIHQFIYELRTQVNDKFISSFETTNDIILSLKNQFAGLFQLFLRNEENVTEGKTAYDLHESVNKMKEILNEFNQQKNNFFNKFDSTLLSNNQALTTLKRHIGLKKSAFFATDFDSLKEILSLAGFEQITDDSNTSAYCFKKITVHDKIKTIKTLILNFKLFSDEGKLVPVRSVKIAEEYVKLEEKIEDSSDDIPF